ncbi:TetR/AcrR family transcriptional regulator [Devosia sp.]|uniref:TetR/AcrR family transcriptional regulator n=1 Tax=Devosia sp. TaxID=1871048 RepID=UPI003264AF77
MSTSTNSPPYHHGDLRRALVDAALVMLEREGEAGLGLRDLARAVGVSPAAPYRHFDSRIALLETLAVIGFQKFTRMMASLQETTPDQKLSAMGRAYVLFALDNANLFRLMFSAQLKREGRPGLKMAADAAFETLQLVSGEGSGGRVAALAAWAKVHGLAVLLLDGQIAIRAGDDTEALIVEILGRNP